MAATHEKKQDGRGNEPEEMAASSQGMDSRWRWRGYDKTKACGAAWPGPGPGPREAPGGGGAPCPGPPAQPAITTERASLRSWGAQARQRERRHPNPRLETQLPGFKDAGPEGCSCGAGGHRGWVSAPGKPQQAHPEAESGPWAVPPFLGGGQQPRRVRGVGKASNMKTGTKIKTGKRKKRERERRQERLPTRKHRCTERQDTTGRHKDNLRIRVQLENIKTLLPDKKG